MTTSFALIAKSSGNIIANGQNGETIFRGSGYYGPQWQASGAIPDAFSSGTPPPRIPQQTFLGASIRNFTMNGGFGDTSSTLNVELVNDEYNVSDRTGLSLGADKYHNGQCDIFNPPPPGSPVFFNFGSILEPAESGFLKAYSHIYKNSPSGNNIVFGGILQSYVQNRGPGGNPVYSVQVVDPREILSNVTLILNNYSGPSYGRNNILNIYGFLEYNPSDTTLVSLKSLGASSILQKSSRIDGTMYYNGDDTFHSLQPGFVSTIPNPFPITGTGFSRRGNQGIPYYRVEQAVNALLGYYGQLPPEYKNAGFATSINFRGANYVIDFGTLPKLPPSYFLDFDEINMLDLALEICDITSRDLFVSLLPIIDNPYCKKLFDYNRGPPPLSPNSGIAGIIRLDAIDRSNPPNYGVIKNYIDNISSGANGIYVENQDVGFELSNVVTDKFIIGAQEVNNYFFSTAADRDEYSVRDRRGGGNSYAQPTGYQWTLEASLEQQVLPYYGLLGNSAVTIPKGFGSYQQILLDATSLNANGVGSYYVATEMELRCALISFDRWKDFLALYNDTYMESVEVNDLTEQGALSASPAIGQEPPVFQLSNNYVVTVPRSVFPSYAIMDYGQDGYPYSPCNPPYGYPLYYKRMTKIGIPEGGLTRINNRYHRMLTNFAELKNTDSDNFAAVLNSQYSQLLQNSEDAEFTPFERTYLTTIKNLINNPNRTRADITNAIGFIQNHINDNKAIFGILPKLAKKNLQNAMKVYNFVRSIAEECLGKKFLVKIPNKVNLKFRNIISDNFHTYGPYGFIPRSTVSGIIGDLSQQFVDEILALGRQLPRNTHTFKTFLNSGSTLPTGNYTGALKTNYNPISDKYEYNYSPMNDGGFFAYEFFQNINQSGAMPLGVVQGLIPQDLTKFINEQGRISPYVRFDHSQYLSFENFSPEDFTQQVITVSGMVPDLCEFLDNTSIDGNVFHSFPSQNNIDELENSREAIGSIAFVKCSVDEKFYMPPKTIISGCQVHATRVIDKGSKSIPNKIYIPCSGLSEDKTRLVAGTGVYVDSFTYYKANYVPASGGAGRQNILTFNQIIIPELNNLKLIGTRFNELDNSNVYALITLPNRVIPTKDARFRDSIFQTVNTENFKHLMTMDVVKGVPGFDVPSYLGGPAQSLFKDKTYDCSTIPIDVRMQAHKAAEVALNKLSFALPQQVQLAMPSPVYPNLVSLPLMCKDRNYGPWISSYNIGGKTEFVRDENLSPWNYAGHDLMNAAGFTQSQFSNSLLLYSERGGFVMPGLPPTSNGAICLGKVLMSGGPLVTNMQMDIGENGIRTTVKMDLYTSNFGKLQKQKQDMISKISRERQRLRDERNALVRKAFGKYQSSRNLGSEYAALARGDINSFANQVGSTTNGAMTHIIIESKNNIADKNSSLIVGNNIATNEINRIGSVQNINSISNVAQNFANGQQLSNSYYNTAGASVTEIFAPVSNDIAHPNMASRPQSFNGARSSLYFNENSQYSQSDVTLET